MALSLKCSDMGGTCDHEITGATEEELVVAGMVHVREAHPEMVADIEAMTPEQKAEWRKTSVHDKLVATGQIQDEDPATPEEEEKEIAMM